jgi:hypothetical protein
MQKCPNCGVLYPSEILTPVVTNGENTPPLCGICALQFINSASGIHRHKFQGQAAEGLRQAAIEWRRKQGVQP